MMRLHDILETRRPPNYRSYFHGTSDVKTLYQILDNGLRPSKYRGRAYLGSLKMALAYGPYILEVLVNRNDQGLTRDEDELAFDSAVDQGPAAWRDYFADNPGIKKQHQFKLAARDYYEGGDPTRITALAKQLRHYPDRQVGPERTAGIGSNVAVARPITTRGRSKIIAAYRFEALPRNFDTPYGRGIYRCTEVLYGRGSLSPGVEAMSPENKIDTYDDY